MFVLSRNSASELHLLHILWDAVFETILLCMEIVECYEYWNKLPNNVAHFKIFASVIYLLQEKQIWIWPYWIL